MWDGLAAGFFDVADRRRQLSAKGDDLERIAGVVQAMHALSDKRCEYLIKDRLSFVRFLGLGVADPVPDANTIWTFREALKRAGAIDALFGRFDAAMHAQGYLAMRGQIVDATIIAASKQRNTEAERAAIKAGAIKPAPSSRADPAGLEGDARQAAPEGSRCTLDGEVQPRQARQDGAPQHDIAVPAFGDKNHVSIDRRHGLIPSLGHNRRGSP